MVKNSDLKKITEFFSKLTSTFFGKYLLLSNRLNLFNKKILPIYK